MGIKWKLPKFSMCVCRAWEWAVGDHHGDILLTSNEVPFLYSALPPNYFLHYTFWFQLQMSQWFHWWTGSHSFCKPLYRIFQDVISSPCAIPHSAPFGFESFNNFENFLILLKVLCSCSLPDAFLFSVLFFNCAGVSGGTENLHVCLIYLSEPETFIL